ncbi:MAG TPA: hypothetical protein VKD72_14705 [Gemmataceae bacterium]|nr:hypothetical protein [Gemmataceae bacterium]
MMDNNDPDNFCPLDEEAALLFGEIQEQIKTLNAQAHGALALYLRQHKLNGQWRVADNGRELRRILPDPVPNVS